MARAALPKVDLFVPRVTQKAPHFGAASAGRGCLGTLSPKLYIRRAEEAAGRAEAAARAVEERERTAQARLAEAEEGEKVPPTLNHPEP